MIPCSHSALSFPRCSGTNYPNPKCNQLIFNFTYKKWTTDKCLTKCSICSILSFTRFVDTCIFFLTINYDFYLWTRIKIFLNTKKTTTNMLINFTYKLTQLGNWKYWSTEYSSNERNDQLVICKRCFIKYVTSTSPSTLYNYEALDGLLKGTAILISALHQITTYVKNIFTRQTTILNLQYQNAITSQLS